jgi:hypothetical protein
VIDHARIVSLCVKTVERERKSVSRNEGRATLSKRGTDGPGSRSTDRNGVGEGREIGKAHFISSDFIGSGRPGAAATPPGSHEGRVRARAGPWLQALLRELAAFNKGLCVITTRLAVADLAEHEGGRSGALS